MLIFLLWSKNSIHERQEEKLCKWLARPSPYFEQNTVFAASSAKDDPRVFTFPSEQVHVNMYGHA